MTVVDAIKWLAENHPFVSVIMWFTVVLWFGLFADALSAERYQGRY